MELRHKINILAYVAFVISEILRNVRFKEESVILDSFITVVSFMSLFTFYNYVTDSIELPLEIS